jgi:hypothetical protein
MTDNPRRTKGGGWAVLAVGLVVVPILYVLSSGPAIWLGHKGVLPVEFILVVYSPIDWACDSSESFKRALEWYIDLWSPY